LKLTHIVLTFGRISSWSFSSGALYARDVATRGLLKPPYHRCRNALLVPSHIAPDHR